VDRHAELLATEYSFLVPIPAVPAPSSTCHAVLLRQGSAGACVVLAPELALDNGLRTEATFRSAWDRRPGNGANRTTARPAGGMFSGITVITFLVSVRLHRSPAWPPLPDAAPSVTVPPANRHSGGLDRAVGVRIPPPEVLATDAPYDPARRRVQLAGGRTSGPPGSAKTELMRR
jgi:hypothetical protein